MTNANDLERRSGGLLPLLYVAAGVVTFSLHLLFSERITSILISDRMAEAPQALVVKLGLWTAVACAFLLWFNWKVTWKVLSRSKLKMFCLVFAITSLFPLLAGYFIAMRDLW